MSKLLYIPAGEYIYFYKPINNNGPLEYKLICDFKDSDVYSLFYSLLNSHQLSGDSNWKKQNWFLKFPILKEELEIIKAEE